MRLLIIFLVALSSCAMQAGRYTKAGAFNDSNIPSGRTFEQEFLKKINTIRASGCKCGKTYMSPVAPLKWDTKLETAAINHARDMYKNNYLTHTNSKGQTIKQRIEAAGYKLRGTYSYGENIASGQRSIDRVIQGWLQSEGHCKNLMNPAFKDIGAAQFNYYWVQEFAMHIPFAG
jgi:uncharacterized protein YkwD